MKGDQLERWQELCSQAAIELDSKKLMELIQEINRLLEQKEQRLLRERAKASAQS